MDRVRTGLLGRWDRAVGPGATTAENVGTVCLAVAGALLAPRFGSDASPDPKAFAQRSRHLAVRVMAFDLWGGAWCNNTPASARWYQREGQGPTQHLTFAAAHLHPFLLAWLDRSEKDGRPRWLWASALYGYLMVATVVVTQGEHRRRRVGLVATAGGVALNEFLGGSASAPWFAPVYYVKLLAGHAAGAAATPGGPFTGRA